MIFKLTATKSNPKLAITGAVNPAHWSRVTASFDALVSVNEIEGIIKGGAAYRSRWMQLCDSIENRAFGKRCVNIGTQVSDIGEYEDLGTCGCAYVLGNGQKSCDNRFKGEKMLGAIFQR